LVRQLFLVLVVQVAKLIGATISAVALHKIRLKRQEEPVAVLAEQLQRVVLEKQEILELQVELD
jgi:hypothetical protein